MSRSFENAQEAFEQFFTEVKVYGLDVDNTKAIFNVGFYIKNPLDNLIKTPWRRWSHEYAEYEWQWYLSGDPSAIEISKRAKIWEKHMDWNGNVNSNYGYQWNRNRQLDYVCGLLVQKPETRQAWITIHDGKEWDTFYKDTPCTLSIGFTRLGLVLNMTVLMRSNDLYYGFCNDQYCFSKLLQLVCEKTNLVPGTYFHYAQNLHIYNDKLNKNETIQARGNSL